MTDENVSGIVVTNAWNQARTEHTIRTEAAYSRAHAEQIHRERMASDAALRDVTEHYGQAQCDKLDGIDDELKQLRREAREREKRQVQREETKEQLENAAIEARRKMLKTEGKWAQTKSALHCSSPEARERTAHEALSFLKAIDWSPKVLEYCDRISVGQPDFALQSPREKQQALWAEIHPVYAEATEGLLADAFEGFSQRRTLTLADHTGTTPGAKMNRTLAIMTLVAQTDRFLNTPVAYFSITPKQAAPFRRTMAELEATLDPECRDVVRALAQQKLLERDGSGKVSPELERKLVDLFVPGVVRAFGQRLQCTRPAPRPAVATAEELEKFDPVERDDSGAQPPSRLGLGFLCLVSVVASLWGGGLLGFAGSLVVGLVVLTILCVAEGPLGRAGIRRQEAKLDRRRSELRPQLAAANARAQNDLNDWLATGRPEREQVRAAYGRTFPVLAESLDFTLQEAEEGFPVGLNGTNAAGEFDPARTLRQAGVAVAGTVGDPRQGVIDESMAELRQWERECPGKLQQLNLALAYFTYGTEMSVVREFTGTVRPDSRISSWSEPAYAFPEREKRAVVWKCRRPFTLLFIVVGLSGPGWILHGKIIEAQAAADAAAAAAINEKAAAARLAAVEEAFTGKPEHSFEEIAQVFRADGHFKGELLQRRQNGDVSIYRLIIRVGWAGGVSPFSGKIGAMVYYPELVAEKGASGEVSRENRDKDGCGILLTENYVYVNRRNALEHISYPRPDQR